MVTAQLEENALPARLVAKQASTTPGSSAHAEPAPINVEYVTPTAASLATKIIN